MRVLRRLAVSISGIILATTAVVAIGSPANADSGDGWVGCNSGEICFAEASSINLIKHFWWGAEHDQYKYWNVSANAQSNTWVIHTMSYFANKDTQCRITIFDDYGTGISFSRGDSTYYSWLDQLYQELPWWQDPSAPALALAWNNANNNHTRC